MFVTSTFKMFSPGGHDPFFVFFDYLLDGLYLSVAESVPDSQFDQRFHPKFGLT